MSLLSLLDAAAMKPDAFRSIDLIPNSLDLTKTSDINLLLDDRYKRKTSISSDDEMIRELSDHIFEFIHYSIVVKPSYPILIIDLHLAFLQFFDIIHQNLSNFSSYQSLLESCADSLKRNVHFSKIFSPVDIENLSEMLKNGSDFMDYYYRNHPEQFKRNIAVLNERLKSALNQIKHLEPQKFGSFMIDCLDKRYSQINDYILNLFDMFGHGDEYGNEDLSTVEILLWIEKAIEAIDNEKMHGNLSKILLNFIELEVLNRSKDFINFDELRSVLKMTSFEIRKHNDFIFSDKYQIDLVASIFKIPARFIAVNNFNKYIDFKSEREIKPIRMGRLLREFFGDTEENYVFRTYEIELILYLIQDIGNKGSDLRSHLIEKTPFDFSGFEPKITRIIGNFSSIATEMNEKDFDNLIMSIHYFLVDESPKSIKELIQKFAKIFEDKIYESYDSVKEDDEKTKDEIAFCLDLGITVNFSIAKDYVFNHILNLKRDTSFSNNPCLICTDHLSIVGIESGDEGDSDDDTDCPMISHREYFKMNAFESNGGSVDENEALNSFFDENFLDFDGEDDDSSLSINAISDGTINS